MTRKNTVAKPKLGRPFAETTVGDLTRSKRAAEYLERLKENKGKRIVVDLDATAVVAMGDLLAVDYAESQKAVVVKALMAAHARIKKNT